MARIISLIVFVGAILSGCGNGKNSTVDTKIVVNNPTVVNLIPECRSGNCEIKDGILWISEDFAKHIQKDQLENILRSFEKGVIEAEAKNKTIKEQKKTINDKNLQSFN